MKALYGSKPSRSWIGFAVVFSLGGCTIATPYKELAAEPDADGENTVVISLTHAVLSDDRSKRKRFWNQVESVQATLSNRPGLIGYSMRRELLGNDAWTMTVWRDKESLQAFVTSPTHLAAMRDGLPGLEDARFARFEVERQRVPLSWETALSYLDTHSRGYGDAQ